VRIKCIKAAAAEKFLVQQARLDDSTEYYNQKRPDQALNIQMPAELWKKSPRHYRVFKYPFHDLIAQITNSVWLLSFMRYDLGYFDAETIRMEPIKNPFRSNLLPT
jgi:putative transposase